MRYFIRFSYDGSKFYGFQRLPNQNSVQNVIEHALSQIGNGPIILKGAGRTDRGVHAYEQCAHFDMESNFSSDKLREVLNKRIAPYIYIMECREVSSDFHARFSVVQKTYQYRIYLGVYNPLLADYCYECSYPLQIAKMIEVLSLFIGVHDFEMFVSGEREHFNAIIYDACMVQNGDFLDITFVGKSFYRYMVRNLVGAMLDVGRGKREVCEVLHALQKDCDVRRFSTAPSCGLYLKKIDYEVN